MTLFYQKNKILSICIYWILFSTPALAIEAPPIAHLPHLNQKSSSPKQTPPSLSDLHIERIEDTKVYFTPIGLQPPPPLETHLHQLKPIGKIQAASKQSLPHLIFSGQTCINCNEDPSLYIFQPNTHRPTILSYPGKILDPHSRATLSESRGFYGRCLGRENDVLIFFQREKIDRKSHLQSSVLIVEAEDQQLSESLIEKKLPSLQGVLKRVKQKTCFEIQGRQRLMSPHKIDISPQRTAQADQSEPPKETH